MRQIYLLLSCVAAMMFSASCSEKSIEDITLAFEVRNAEIDEVVIVYDREIYPVPLNADGKAVYMISGKRFLYPKIFYGQEYVNAYFEQGDNLTVTFDGQDFVKSFTVSGQGNATESYLNDIVYQPLPDDQYALDLQEYKEKLQAKENAAVKLLENSEAVSHKEFVRNERARIRYSYGASRIMYSVGHMIMSQNPDYMPDDAYYDYVAELVVEDEGLTDLEEYRDYMIEAAAMLSAKGQKRDFYHKTLDQMEYLSDNIQSVRLRERLMYQTIASYVDQVGTEKLGDLSNLFKTFVKDSVLVSSYEQKCAKWDFSAPGRISPDFNAVDVHGKKYTLEDFRGKYVYIDLWATWCQPCRKEIPFMKKMEEKYSDKNIFFVSLSVDKDKKAWETMVSKGEMSGFQLYIGQNSGFQKAYRADGIPRFILLDKGGRILNNNMTRPSDPKTAVMIDGLLKN